MNSQLIRNAHLNQNVIHRHIGDQQKIFLIMWGKHRKNLKHDYYNGEKIGILKKYKK